MQKIITLLFGIVLFSTGCKSEKKEKEELTIGTKKQEISTFDLGKSVFNGKGKCYTCHKTDKKSIGPSIQEIIKVYKEQNGDIIAFLKQNAEPIVDPETYAVMKTNFAIIKTFTPEELEAVKIYMMDVSKGKTQ
ncbi:c-type cytochrome [Aquimarina muelleri]|uniref:c-type cytochrome n=1 Tax=Aquimarina muelleri TaxID=279356 RepID=UPI003F683B7A